MRISTDHEWAFPLNHIVELDVVGSDELVLAVLWVVGNILCREREKNKLLGKGRETTTEWKERRKWKKKGRQLPQQKNFNQPSSRT